MRFLAMSFLMRVWSKYVPLKGVSIRVVELALLVCRVGQTPHVVAYRRPATKAILGNGVPFLGRIPSKMASQSSC